MDSDRFDALARTLASSTSRRDVLRRLRRAGAAAAVLGVFGLRQRSSAHHCTYEGCGCATGTQHPCGRGLVCCPSSPGTPGGAGVCAPRGQCGGSCVDYGYACPGYCNWGDSCSDCCSGFCGQVGSCADPAVGRACGGGTLNPCDPGLVCCPYVPGLAGGAGVCERRC
jgi:hypothetical protein